MASVPISEVAISAVTEGELRYGLALKPEATRLEALVKKFLLALRVEPWDSGAAVQYGILRASLERAGKTMGNLDMMIAAHALALKCVLVTNDGTFQRIEALKLADWTRRTGLSQHRTPTV